MYLIKTPWWLKKIYPSFIWNIKEADKTIYLTFDDGPHETVTPFVLDELKKFNAKATFFCIGKNVLSQSNIYQRILEEGHSVGNHTYNHLKGWKTADELYIDDINNASQLINSNLFRPPYGRIKKSQANLLHHHSETLNQKFQIIMWDVLSGDFDPGINAEKCLKNVVKHAGSGDIVVFHDSAKAFEKLRFALPKVLAQFTEQGYQFERIVL